MRDRGCSLKGEEKSFRCGRGGTAFGQKKKRLGGLYKRTKGKEKTGIDSTRRRKERKNRKKGLSGEGVI